MIDMGTGHQALVQKGKTCWPAACLKATVGYHDSAAYYGSSATAPASGLQALACSCLPVRQPVASAGLGVFAAWQQHTLLFGQGSKSQSGTTADCTGCTILCKAMPRPLGGVQAHYVCQLYVHSPSVSHLLPRYRRSIKSLAILMSLPYLAPAASTSLEASVGL